MKLVADHTNTDLSARNLLWLAESFLLCSRSDIRSATLPGYAANFSSGSYYVLDAAGVADIVNQYLNPYEKGAEADGSVHPQRLIFSMYIDPTRYSGRPADCASRLPKEQRCYDLLDRLGIAYFARRS